MNVAGTKVVFQSKRALDGAQNGVAAFSSNIWIMEASGSGATALTRNSVGYLDSSNPKFSPDGTKVVFQSRMPLSSNGTTWNGSPLPVSNIWVMNIDGTGLTPLTQNTLPGLDSVTPSFDSLSAKITFSSKMDVAAAWDVLSSSSSNIFEMNADGTGLTALTTNTLSYLDSWNPVYSPDSVNIAFSSYTSTGGAMNNQNTFSANIVTVPSGGGALTFWTTNTNPWLDSITPAFLPDATGSEIAFASRADVGGAVNTYGTNSYNIIKVAAGPVLTALTANTLPYHDSFGPAYSPDQTTVVFHSFSDINGATNGTRSYSSNIMTVPAAAGAITALTTNTSSGMDSQFAVFDPTSALVVFFSNMDLSGTANAGRSGSTNIWSMTSGGASKTALTNSTASCVNL